jgi:hypothetical protein
LGRKQLEQIDQIERMCGCWDSRPLVQAVNQKLIFAYKKRTFCSGCIIFPEIHKRVSCACLNPAQNHKVLSSILDREMFRTFLLLQCLIAIGLACKCAPVTWKQAFEQAKYGSFDLAIPSFIGF